MIVDTDTRLIASHGGVLVDRTGARPAGIDALELLEERALIPAAVTV